jgi:hypothetical protein
VGWSREHHFVPKCYLRYFSADGRRINPFNFARGKTIRGVSIKHQCSRHNFCDFAPTSRIDWVSLLIYLGNWRLGANSFGQRYGEPSGPCRSFA